MTIDFGKRKQGSTPIFEFTWPLLSGDSPDDLTGYTLSATLRNVDSLAVTAVTGDITVVDGATRLCQWDMSAADLGTVGTFGVTLTGTDGTRFLKTLYGSLVVEEDPAVTAVGAPPVVGVSQTEASLLAALLADMPDGVLDEDDMASDSATAVPTQQSVKAYADTKQAKDVGATEGNAAKMDADGQAVDAGFAFGTAAANDTEDFDVAGAAEAVKDSVKILPSMDLVAAQAVVDTAAGYPVFIAPGTHTWSGALQVPSNTTIRGAGNSTIITLAAGSDSDLITNDDWVNGNTGILIENLYLDGNRLNQSHAPVGDGPGQSLISFVNVSKSTIRGVQGTSPYFHGIDLNVRDSTVNSYGDPGCTDIIIDNCVFTDFGDDGISPHWSSGIVISNCVCHGAAASYSGSSNGFECDDGSHDVTLANCIAYDNVNGFMVQAHASRPRAVNISMIGCYSHNNSNAGFRITGTNPVSADPGDLISITGCRMVDEANGLWIDDYLNVSVTGCIWDTVTTPVLYVQAESDQTGGLALTACQFARSGALYIVDTTVGSVLISNCVFMYGTATYSIVVASDNMAISNCIIKYNSAGGGIQVLDGADNCRITGNEISFNNGTGINLKGTNAWVANNMIFGNKTQGIRLNGQYENQYIGSNRLYSVGTYVQTYGIKVDNIDGVALIHANNVVGNGTDGINIGAGSGGNTVFSDNIGYP